ncbi:hypothetical protein BDY19DRAFT_990034 [Irpex rosettiformis]|uniref:Uncharacterized protein n=1 Tax=Irpex rosettiformis TaxID=378272 RepID=A0ACB8UGI1_9APHY|nr:hypothetical protein BDY19DRAFT_990034 [Irpex rosettiformis]
MEPSSIAEQRATAVAKLKRAASLPRMKDGRRPPMHVEAVSEGERADETDRPDEDSGQGSDGGPRDSPEAPEVSEGGGRSDALSNVEDPERGRQQEQVAETVVVSVMDDKTEDSKSFTEQTERPSTPGRKRRSRSRARSRGSKDLRLKTKTPPPVNNESSADEYGLEDAPSAPPVISSPIPSHFPAFQGTQFLRSPISPGPGMFYPGTTPSTPMLPSLEQIQKGIGLFRSNSVGAARMLAMHKLTAGAEGASFDPTFGLQSQTPLGRNNTVSGGERIAVRTNLLRRLGERVEKADVDQTSAGEEIVRPTTPGTSRRRKRRSRRSAVLDDRDERDREQPSTTPTTPVVPASPLPNASFNQRPSMPELVGTPVQQLAEAPVLPPMGGRGVVIEDEDEDADGHPSGQAYGLPSTPARRAGLRLPHASDTPDKEHPFPASPFATPLREKPFLEEDEEADGYRSLPVRAPSRNAANELSWIAEAVPRMPIHDDEDDEGGDADEEREQEEHEEQEEQDDQDDQEDREEQEEQGPDQPPPEIEQEEQEEIDTRPSDDRSEHSYYGTSPDLTSVSKDLVIEVETSPELSPSHMPPSPASVMALSFAQTNDTPASARPSPRTYPMRLSVATPALQSEPSPSTTGFPDWDETRPEIAQKRTGEGVAGTWDRIKNVLTRSNSSGGRRSRTNSISARDRRNNTDSSVSRESRGSLTSPKGDRNSELAQQTQLLMQSPSASASILSLSPQGVPHTPMSPVPPASSADLLKYADSKLFPFPGIKQLEEQRNKAKGISSASSPDLILAPNGIEQIPSTSSASSATTKSPELFRERKVSHQASDTRLLAKFTGLSPLSPIAIVPSSSSNDYFSLSSTTTTNSGGSLGSALSKLPTNREGVRKWLTAKKIFSSQHSTPTTPSIPLASPPISPPADLKPRVAMKKPSLSDLLSSTRKESDGSDWEDIGVEKSNTPTSATSPLKLGKQSLKDDSKAIEVHVDVTESTGRDQYPQPAQSPRVIQANHAAEFSPLSSPPELLSSTTPDPLSSLDEYPTLSTSDSQSSSSDSPGMHHPLQTDKAGVIMARLEEALGRGSKSSIWPIAIDDPPRKLVLCSPVLQVANANTVKDRFLFLFNDLLVIAKPVVPEQDILLDTTKPTPMDRKFVVKSVVLLRNVKFNADREDTYSKVASAAGPMRHPVIRTFVHQFSKDPDQAIIAFFEKCHCRDDPIALGQLIFRTTDLDRMRLGEYLSRRTSKVVLKAYVDSFGFAGMRIDKALRAFLLSLGVPPKASLDYLLDAFASRWFEANAGIVAYQKDLAARLVKAIVQLNEVMHGGIAQTTGMTGYPRRSVISRDFVEAFRRFDPRGQVPDEILDKIYAAIRRERLSQARRPTGEVNDHDITIVIKRPIPPRLTYRQQSEPIVLRIPSTDPHLTIQLFGQDLAFEPPELTFVKSPEASFRVTGMSLGPKTVIMRRCGANALAYSGLPLSSPIMVERAFMRNTFQIAFLNHHGEKRKYMFSVEDPLVRHQWTVSLKQNIDAASNPPPPRVEPSGSRFKSQKAVEDLTLKVLQDTLISSEDDFSSPFPSAVDHALARLNGSSASTNGSPNTSYVHSTPNKARRQSKDTITHARSKSRSQVYHRHGLGRWEPDADESEEDGLLRRDISSSQLAGEKAWSGHDLEVICRQNSSLPSLLAYLCLGPSGMDGS